MDFFHWFLLIGNHKEETLAASQAVRALAHQVGPRSQGLARGHAQINLEMVKSFVSGLIEFILQRLQSISSYEKRGPS